ncbi:MAG: alpha/beta hydrolase [Bacteroidetes bacterium]|nr:alpha/beta hydrolase [Bacteroidota bacterium]
MFTPIQGRNLTKNISGFTIAYDDMGEGTPIIFLHGFPFNKSMWKDQYDYLKQNFRVIAPDLRSFGNSKDDSSELSMDLFANDLIALMDDLKLDKVTVCGLSMGGYIALNAIQRYPERFDTIILCDTQCNADTEEGKAKRYKSIEEIKSKGTSEFTEGFLKNAFHPDTLTSKPEIVSDTRTMMLSNSIQAFTHGLKALAERKDTCSKLDQINVPALIICGSDDTLTPVSKAQYLHENIKGSQLSIIPKAGHISNMEQPDEFNKIVYDFLKS